MNAHSHIFIRIVTLTLITGYVCTIIGVILTLVMSCQTNLTNSRSVPSDYHRVNLLRLVCKQVLGPKV